MVVPTARTLFVILPRAGDFAIRRTGKRQSNTLMALRRNEVYPRIRIRRYARGGAISLVLACVLSLAVAAATADAAPGDPKKGTPPQELWEAFPLNPKGELLGGNPKGQPLGGNRQRTSPSAPFSPPARPQTAAVSPPRASGSDFPLLALAGGAGALILLALLGLAAVRLRNVGRHRHHSVPLWQGTAGLDHATSTVARMQHYSDVDVPLTRSSRPAPRSAPSAGRPRRRRAQTPPNSRAIVDRVRDTMWNEGTAPVIVGSAIAVAVAFLIVHYGG